MLIVKTKLKEIKGKGIGLIADQNIRKGELIGKDDFRIDREFKESFLNKLGNEYGAFKQMLEIYSTYDAERNLYHFSIDNWRFCNHSAKPNTEWNGSDDWEYIALRDIKRGEEITCNYYQFETHLNFKIKK